MTSPCSRILSTTARDLRIRSRDPSVNSMRSFPVATALNCASEIWRPEISTARSYLLDHEMTKPGGTDLTNGPHRPITVRRRDENIPQPATLAHLNLTALSRQVLQRWDESHGLRHSAFRSFRIAQTLRNLSIVRLRVARCEVPRRLRGSG